MSSAYFNLLLTLITDHTSSSALAAGKSESQTYSRGLFFLCFMVYMQADLRLALAYCPIPRFFSVYFFLIIDE